MATSAIPETVEQIIPEVSPNAEPREKASVEKVTVEVHDGPFRPSPRDYVRWLRDLFTRQRLLESAAVVVKLGKFMGPGAIISVAYIDPDNYQTAVSSGTQFQYKLLFMILVSNLIAIYLQVSSRDFVEANWLILASRRCQSNWDLSQVWILRNAIEPIFPAGLTLASGSWLKPP